MALTDNKRMKTKRRTKPRPIGAGTNLSWSDKQKLQAVQSWLALGNLALVARIHGIPEDTLRDWRVTTWWKETVEDLKLSEKVELSARMKKLIEASQTLVAQRLETGDPIMNQKTGEIVYKPVSMKDAHRVAVDLIDRRANVEKLTQDNEMTDERADDKLAKLAERFAEMATKSIETQINKRRTVDAEDIEMAQDDTVPDDLLLSDSSSSSELGEEDEGEDRGN